MTRLSARAVGVRRGGRAILKDVSFSAGPGEFIALIGANGAGKSTLLSVLTGLFRPDAGHAALDDAPIQGLKGRDLARRRAYLPQNPRCEWPISVERLAALGLTPVLPAFGALAPDFQARITEALADCDLLDQRLQPATTLSGGELARAMLARALVGDPAILIADEPMAGLDPRHALDAARRLRALAGRGKLVIAAVHDLTLAARFSTRILALREGRLVADGPTAETLTAALVRTVFDVEARIAGEPGRAFVDFLPPDA